MCEKSSRKKPKMINDSWIESISNDVEKSRSLIKKALSEAGDKNTFFTKYKSNKKQKK